MVAAVAWDQLDENTRERVTAHADMIQHRCWHHVDMPFSRDGTTLEQPPTINAKTRIERFRDSICSNASDNVKSYDLVWLIHLVGDVHQPLHATSRFSAAAPHGDRGGNHVNLCEAPCRKELHAFWDGAAGTGNSPTAAIKAAAQLAEAPSDAAELTDVQKWIDQSFNLAQKFVYGAPIGDDNGPFTLTQAYKTKAKSIAQDQITLAGARLAKLDHRKFAVDSLAQTGSRSQRGHCRAR